MTLDQLLLGSALRHLAGVTYDAAARPKAHRMDCTRATYAILLDVYGPIIQPISAALHIRSAADPFSNVTALAGLGLGQLVDRPGVGWSLCQGWKSLDPLRGGHAWLWWEPPIPSAERPMIVQATPAQPWCEYRDWHAQRAKFSAGVKVCQLREVNHA